MVLIEEEEEEEAEEELVEMKERLLDGELEDPEGCEDGIEGFGAMAQQRAAALHGTRTLNHSRHC